MFMEAPQALIYIAGGAFLLGWLVGKIGAYFGNKFAASKRDPRDDRIRSLDAEVRVAQTDAEKAKVELEDRTRELAEEKERVAERDTAVTSLQDKVAQLRADLKESVKKTRELRSELTDRATETVRSEVMLREAQTELSVANASTDMLATGVLDYSMAPDGKNDEQQIPDESVSAKTATK